MSKKKTPAEAVADEVVDRAVKAVGDELVKRFKPKVPEGYEMRHGLPQKKRG